MLMAYRRAQAAATGTTRNSSDSFPQHENSIWLLRLRFFVSFLDDMVNKNMVESESKYNMYMYLRMQHSKYTEIHNDNEEIVS